MVIISSHPKAFDLAYRVIFSSDPKESALANIGREANLNFSTYTRFKDPQLVALGAVARIQHDVMS